MLGYQANTKGSRIMVGKKVEASRDVVFDESIKGIPVALDKSRDIFEGLLDLECEDHTPVVPADNGGGHDDGLAMLPPVSGVGQSGQSGQSIPLYPPIH